MDVKTLAKMTKWMETTDLEEISWKNGDDKICLKLNNQPEHNISPASTMQPILSPSIGIFRFSTPGKTAIIKEGAAVKKDQQLGIIEVGKNHKSVTATVDGFLKIISIEDGKAVEYGQPLFFISPK